MILSNYTHLEEFETSIKIENKILCLQEQLFHLKEKKHLAFKEPIKAHLYACIRRQIAQLKFKLGQKLQKKK